jgi:hypothetical protein
MSSTSFSFRQRLPRRLRRFHDREPPGIRAGKWIRAEKKLRVHEVVVDRDLAQIFPRQRDRPVLDFEIQRRFRRREHSLLPLAIGLRVVADYSLSFDFIELRADLGEERPPAIHRIVRISRREPAAVGLGRSS